VQSFLLAKRGLVDRALDSSSVGACCGLGSLRTPGNPKGQRILCDALQEVTPASSFQTSLEGQRLVADAAGNESPRVLQRADELSRHLLGAAGEFLGMSRRLKANTDKRRVHSLYRQGQTYLQLLQAMPQIQSEKLLRPFLELLLQHAKTSNLLALL